MRTLVKLLHLPDEAPEGKANYNPDDPYFQQWCQALFNSLDEGGQWAVPRDGLIFTKHGDEFVLTDWMPWMPEMEGVISKAELERQQQSGFEAIREHFEAAGIKVRKQLPSEVDPA